VLKAGVMRASVEAAEAVREAQARHEQQLQAAFDGGYAAGVADGQAAAEAQGHAAAPRLVAVLDRIADDLTVQHAAALEDSTQALLAVAFDLADWVLRTEPGAVAAASASLPQRLSEAARTLAAGPNAVVRCSHEDLAAVSGWARDGVEVLPDPRLAPGEARLDRGDGSAVLMFAAALRAAAETLGMPGER
jgi:flagellar biosynthesis/type III secretory pathway protein FliH